METHDFRKGFRPNQLNEQTFLAVMRGRKIQFKNGPFRSGMGPFIPETLEDVYIHGKHENGQDNFWAVFWHGEDSFENSHWELATGD